MWFINSHSFDYFLPLIEIITATCSKNQRAARKSTWQHLYPFPINQAISKKSQKTFSILNSVWDDIHSRIYDKVLWPRTLTRSGGKKKKIGVGKWSVYLGEQIPRVWCVLSNLPLPRIIGFCLDVFWSDFLGIRYRSGRFKLVSQKKSNFIQVRMG